jgi:hypothetical protein
LFWTLKNLIFDIVSDFGFRPARHCYMATRPACPDLAGPRLSESDGGQVAGGYSDFQKACVMLKYFKLPK